MKELYEKVLRDSNLTGCPTVDTLVKSSGLMSQVMIKLEGLGYNIKRLSAKEMAVLFCALNDIVFVVEDDDFYIATLSQEKLLYLYNNCHVIPSQSQSLNSIRTLIMSNTVEKINEYLNRGCFHFIKLVQENDSPNCFLARLSYMKPYPKITTQQVYALSVVSNWHNIIYNNLLNGCYRIKTNSGMTLCMNKYRSVKSIGASGILRTKDLNNNIISFKVWDIQSFSVYAKNDLVEALQNGVCEYKGVKVTLSRDILYKYYGEELVNTKLESKNVRMAYCYADLCTISANKENISFYLRKYGLESNAKDIMALRSELASKLDNKPESDGKYHLRCLHPIGSVLNKHKSYYLTVDADKLFKELTIVEDVASVLPKVYNYYAIASGIGYTFVSVKATSEDLARKNGKQEFERQFGKEESFCSLTAEGKVVRGYQVFRISIEIQRRLAEVVHWGYTADYDAYAKILRDIAKDNIAITVLDDHIKYLFINNLAKKCKYARNLTIGIVSEELIKFLDLLGGDSKRLDKVMLETYRKLSYNNAYKEWLRLKTENDYSKYIVETIGDTTFIITTYAKFRLTKEGISPKAELIFQGQSLGGVVFKESTK